MLLWTEWRRVWESEGGEINDLKDEKTDFERTRMLSLVTWLDSNMTECNFKDLICEDDSDEDSEEEIKLFETTVWVNY